MTNVDGPRRLAAALALDPSEWRAEAGRVARYGLVGAVATVAYFAATFAGVEWCGWQPAFASIAAQAVTAAPSFYAHALYSFRVTADREYFTRYVVITAFSFLVNFSLVWILTRQAQITYRPAIVAVAIAIPLTNFLLNRFWVFLPGLLARGAARSPE